MFELFYVTFNDNLSVDAPKIYLQFKMRAPSFRCTEGIDGSLILHYYSERPGLEHIVIGIVKVR